MAGKDLITFGQKLRRLRQETGFYQEELAEKLSLIHARCNPTTDLKIDGNRISKWERAFKDKSGREWRPKRQHILYLIEAFAGQLNPEAAQMWALQAGYQLNNDELQTIFASSAYPFPETPPVSNFQTDFRQLGMLPEQHLFGIEQQRQQLLRILEQKEAPWLIAISGIGGIGKTSLANILARDIMFVGRFDDTAWVSAKQEIFLPGAGLQETNRPALDTNTLVDALLEQFNNRSPFPRSLDEKLVILTALLKKQPALVIIDNLETVIDYQTLLPLLRRLSNPSKFLLTSRHNLRAYSDIFCLSLQELDQAEAFALLRYEASMRGLQALVNASETQLKRIYEVTGGNPLALKLVIGQICVLPLSQVIENLKRARGKKTEELYTYIYWQAWQTLCPAGRAVLLGMPLAQGGTLAQITVLNKLEADELNQALELLVALSLIEVGGDIEQRRYYIHRLTETFLLTEVAKW